MTLDDILNETRSESAKRQAKYPLTMVMRKIAKMGPTRGFARALRKRPFSVIAEIKRRSPSMSTINEAAVDVAHGVYHSHRIVSAISVLTQESRFGGSPADLEKVRHKTQCRPTPILRKDFIESEYEIFYSRWIGADAILLMANVVTDKQRFKELHDLAVSIGLDVLCEVHDREEIETIPDTAKICGINSRRFKGVDQHKPLTLKVKETLAPLLGSPPNRDTQTDLEAFGLFGELPSTCLKVAESGVSSENIRGVLARYPFDAALIGTSLLKCRRPDMVRQLDDIASAADSVTQQRGELEVGELVCAGS